MSAQNENQDRDNTPRFYRLASVSVLSNMMIPLAGLCDTAFLGHLAGYTPFSWGDGKHFVGLPISHS